MIKHIAFTVYPSNDVAGTRAWYEETLGLKFAGPYLEDGIEKYNEAHFGEGAFALMASEWVGRQPGTAASIAFEVEDLDHAVEVLRQKGVSVEEIFEGPVCKSTAFNDPEGNKITIHQRSPAKRYA